MLSLSLRSKGLVLLCVVAACCGCHTKKAVVAPAPMQEVALADTTILPLFPAEVLYIIGREWVFARFDIGEVSHASCHKGAC